MKKVLLVGESWHVHVTEAKGFDVFTYDYYEEATEYIRKNIPRIKVPESAATYLLWLDTTELGIDSERLCDIIMEKSGLMLSAGVHYGAAGEGFLRMNLGTSRVRVEEGLERLKAAIDAIEK